MSVFLSSGSPSRSVPSRSLSRSSTTSATDSWTSSRDPAQQTWPWLKKIPFTMPSTAWSTGASSKTTLAALPPSSRVSRLPVPATARLISLPTSVEPVNATLSIPGCATSAEPVWPAPVSTFTTPGGRLGLLAHLGEQQRGQRRRLGRLEHAGVAGASAGASFQAAISSGKFHGITWPATPERPRRRAEARVLQLVGPARVVEEMRRGQRDVHVPGLPDRLAVVEALQDGELAGPLLQDAGDPVQVLGPLRARHRAPDLLVGAARGGDGPVHVGRAGQRDPGERLLGRGVDRRELPPVRGRPELAVDEQPVLGGDRHDLARLRRRGIVPARPARRRRPRQRRLRPRRADSPAGAGWPRSARFTAK